MRMKPRSPAKAARDQRVARATALREPRAFLEGFECVRIPGPVLCISEAHQQVGPFGARSIELGRDVEGGAVVARGLGRREVVERVVAGARRPSLGLAPAARRARSGVRAGRPRPAAAPRRSSPAPRPRARASEHGESSRRRHTARSRRARARSAAIAGPCRRRSRARRAPRHRACRSRPSRGARPCRAARLRRSRRRAPTRR